MFHQKTEPPGFPDRFNQERSNDNSNPPNDCGLLVAILGNPVDAQEQSGAITVFVARKVITMDAGWSSSTAVAVRDGKILSVGSLDELEPWLKTSPYKIDKTFADKILLPGFVEAHGHPFLGGSTITRPLLTYLPAANPYGPEFPGVKTQAEAAAKLAEYVKDAKSPDQTILVYGYDLIAMGGQHLDKTMLDKISMTQPLLVWDASSHFVYANSAALKKYKVTRESTKTNGVMAGADGEPNGQILGTSAERKRNERGLPVHSRDL